MRLVIIFSILFLSFVYQSCASYGLKIVSQENIFHNEEVAFRQCHASSIHSFEKDHLLSVWFAGTHEGHSDVGIWSSHYRQGEWEAPRLIATGEINDSLFYPCWNPVLYQFPGQDALYLYYKIGPNPREWWGVYRYSLDRGQSWSDAVSLPEGILGPIKNKPYALKDGTVLSPSSTESLDEVWKAHIEITKDNGKTWAISKINHVSDVEVIQPSIVRHANGDLQVLCRSKENYVMSAFSSDDGVTWKAWKRTNLRNPNSATDAIRLRNGLFLIVYNPDIAGENWWEGRTRFNVALSKDGLMWNDVLLLEDGKEDDEYSYPTVIQGKDGSIHITYTWNRTHIKHVVLQ